MDSKREKQCGIQQYSSKTQRYEFNIQNSAQQIYAGLFEIADRGKRERLAIVLENARDEYKKGIKQRRMQEFDNLIDLLDTEPFGEQEVEQFIARCQEFVVLGHGGLKSNSANTLILLALLREYVCINTKTKSPYIPVDTVEFTTKVLPRLWEYLKGFSTERLANAINNALAQVVVLEHRQKMSALFDGVYAQYIQGSWAKAHKQGLKKLCDTLRAEKFKENELDDFLRVLSDFLFSDDTKLASNSAKTLLLSALAYQYANVSRNVPPLEIARSLLGYLKEDREQQAVLAKKENVAARTTKTPVRSKGLFAQALSQVTVYDITGLSHGEKARELKHARDVVKERNDAFVCLRDGASIVWCPPGIEAPVKLPITESRLAKFAADPQSVALDHFVRAVIEQKVLGANRIYVNKDETAFSDSEFRNSPYTLNIIDNAAILTHFDVFGRKTIVDLPVSLQAWLSSHYEQLLRDGEPRAVVLRAVQAYIYNAPKPAAPKVREELRENGEHLLQAQLRTKAQAIVEGVLPRKEELKAPLPEGKKLDMTRFQEITRTLGGANGSHSSHKVVNMSMFSSEYGVVLETSQTEKVQDAAIPAPPPLPWSIRL